MATCPKCHTGNEEGLTRCRACNAILPVKLGSKSNTRWERVRRQPDLVGLDCPKCGAVNPYTRFKCKDCGASLVQRKPQSDITRIWIYVGIGVVIAVLTIVFGVRGV